MTWAASRSIWRRTGKVYVNLEDKDQVAVVDLKARKVLAHWPVVPGGSPVGLAIETENQRLFIGCRKPQKMVVLRSTDDGKVLGDIPIAAAWTPHAETVITHLRALAKAS